MINILSYVGMDLHSEVCLWTLLGLLRTIFDATLFKVNANLKQVWQMRMPEELTRPVQRVLRTMISGVILVQCFTVYVYLAAYIVLLYPVFLEERPTLVLPWLLLAAIRKLLCELMSLALGLGTCVLLGPARPPCIKFVIVKLASITPAFYKWLLVFSYYHALKMTAAFKTFPAVLPSNDNDYGLELAIRRRRTKSLQDEDQLRKKLIASLYGERNPSMHIFRAISNHNVNTTQTPFDSIEDIRTSLDVLRPLSVSSNKTISDTETYEEWFGTEIALPRVTDRILEQFGVMLLRIADYLKNEETDPGKIFQTNGQIIVNDPDILNCTTSPNDDTDTTPDISTSKGRTASYLTEYPKIFMKKSSDLFHPPTSKHELKQVQNGTNIFTKTEIEKNENVKSVRNIDAQNFVSYEVKRRTVTVEIEVRDDQLMQQNALRQSGNDTSQQEIQCISQKHDKYAESKAVNTTCRLNTQNKSLFIDKKTDRECDSNNKDEKDDKSQNGSTKKEKNKASGKEATGLTNFTFEKSTTTKVYKGMNS